MAPKQFVVDSLNRECQLLAEVVQDLTVKELAWQPSPESNSIGWTLWHMLRVEDMWVQFFAQRQPELWEREGWHEKFGMPTRDTGFGHTSEQVAGFPALDLPSLLQYGKEVRLETQTYLQGLSSSDFENTPWSDRPTIWWHSFNISDMFQQVIGELFQHLGQVAYLKGIQRGFGAIPPTFGTPSKS